MLYSRVDVSLRWVLTRCCTNLWRPSTVLALQVEHPYGSKIQRQKEQTKQRTKKLELDM